jgi:hypothetical protein
VVGHSGAWPTNSLEEPCGRHSVRTGDPFDHATSRRRDDDQDRERECFYCLSGWVFLGSLDHDGEEVFDALRCRKCSGTSWAAARVV